MPIVTGLNANVFRAVSGSLFSSPVNWSRGVVPTGSDVALIADNCTIDISRTLGSLIVQPGFTASINTGLTLNISQSINVMGHLSCSGNPSINILSRNNQISGMSPGSSTVSFTAASQQQVPGVTYNNVVTRGGSSKNLTGNTIISGSLNLNSIADLECSTYNLIVSGAVSVENGGIRKSGYGNITFNSLFFGVDGNNQNKIDFSGNPNVEFRGGFRRGNYDWIRGFNSGYGTWTLSKNNQIFYPCDAPFYPITFNARLLIDDITVTMASSSGMTMMGKIDGTTANSKLVLQSRLNFGSTEIAPMSTSGTFDYTSSAVSILHYANPQNVTLPYNYYTNLEVSNSTKSLRANTSVSGGLYVASNGVIECAGYDFTVTGSTTWIGKLSKSGSGNILFIGSVANDPQAPWTAIDFNGGNPNVEFRNGFSVTGIYGFSFGGTDNLRTGTGSFIFSTNNQSILFYASYFPKYFDAKIVVSGSITASYTNYNTGQPVVLNNTINGTQASSRFVNTANSVLYLGTPSALSGSFLTGAFDFSTVGNTVHLYGNYSATSSIGLNNLYNLAISGTGIKTLGTSSYVSGTLTFTNPATFELSNSNLFVSGTTNTGNGIAITRSGSGITVFNGRVTQLDFGKIDFSYSNSNIEFRNGVDSRYAAYVALGSGSAIFSTNDQSYLGTIVNTGDIIISGSIRLRNQSTFNVYKTINGTSASSILDNSGSIYFMTASAVDNSMLTGSFISASFPGSVLGFAFSGSYKIPFSSFRNLVLNPGGTLTSPESKTLSRDTMIYEGISISRDTLDTENNNLTVLGTTYVVYGGIKKSGSGSILLSGSVDIFDVGAIDFRSASNASLEMRGGIIRGTFASRIDMGTTPVTFSINNQNVVACNNSNQYNNILISGSITVGFGLQAGTFVISGSLNGTDANSRFYLSASSTVIYNSSQQPMQIGILDVSSSSATFTYNSGSQDIRGGIYRNLTMLSGTKTLQGNVSVLGTLNTGSGATLATINLNGFTLTNP